MTAYSLNQCLAIAISTMLMVFLQLKWIMVLMGGFYLYWAICLLIHIKKEKQLQKYLNF